MASLWPFIDYKPRRLPNFVSNFQHLKIFMHSFPQILDLIEAYIKKENFPKSPAALYDPCKYILQIGGKRVRPALVLMGYELFDDKIKKALPIAAAVEYFHNFTLMHDDIMDNAPLRRGKTTVHEKYGVNTGILSGDVMLIFAYQLINSIRDTKAIKKILKIFNKLAIEVCEGQQIDVIFETQPKVTIPEYIKMIEMKTSVLLGGALEMGAILAGASTEDAQHLYQFGRLSGLAFQIQDDFLDTYGDPATFGKMVGGDIMQNKKTLLVLKTLEIASDADKKALTTWLKTTDKTNLETKINAVKAIFDKNNIPTLIKEEKRRMQSAAFAHLDAVNVPKEKKEILRGMIQELLERER
jgi:geranylgeranyl diphosphate synthase, type II